MKATAHKVAHDRAAVPAATGPLVGTIGDSSINRTTGDSNALLIAVGTYDAPMTKIAVPATLWHYTTGAGLLGIFEPRGFDGWKVPPERSLSLWASDARYLNDSEELTYAAATLAEAMVGCVDRSDTDHAARIDALAERAKEGVFVDPDVDDARHTAYVSSFCSEGDLLSQWRGYGSNGYSIEFPTEVLKAFKVPAMRAGNQAAGYVDGSMLYRVRYGLDEALIEEYAREIVKRENYYGAVRMVVECLAQFKHPAFEAENEWRLISSSGHDYTACDYRVSPSGMLIPYLQLRFTPYNMLEPTPDYRYDGLVVKRVRVGPSPQQELRAESVTRMLRQRSFPDIKVENSLTPYRA